MDELLDAVNPENSLISRLGVLAIDLTDDLRSQVTRREFPPASLWWGEPPT